MQQMRRPFCSGGDTIVMEQQAEGKRRGGGRGGGGRKARGFVGGSSGSAHDKVTAAMTFLATGLELPASNVQDE